MKYTFKGVLITILIICSYQLSARKIDDNGMNKSPKVLIIGLQDNVSSNYYYDEMISEQTGIQVDSIDWHYNNVISRNLQSAAKKHSFQVINSAEMLVNDHILSKIEIIGEKEIFSSNIQDIPEEEYKNLMEKLKADYLLIINQHYLKWQEEPMRTVFHMISYSLFDKNKKEIYNGNEYFTSMNLETIKKLENISRRTSSKIANQVQKSIK